MNNLQKEKTVVLNFLKDIDNSPKENLQEVISNHTSDDFKMLCTHPFNELSGSSDIANNLWSPIKDSFTPVQRRLDIFYAGVNSLNENNDVWISSMGHLMGVFNKEFFWFETKL